METTSTTTTLEPAAQRTAAGNVLCIDADDESRHLIAELLYEHEVDFALTADDAVQLAHCRSYDLMFVDPAVPGYDTIDLLTELRLFQRRVPIVICTAGATQCTEGDNIPTQLAKPLSAAAIRETALRLLGA
jgi:CheY-like chemotaxis protein